MAAGSTSGNPGRRPRRSTRQDWYPAMEKIFGVRPVVTFYDNYVVVDNEAGEVRVEGEAVDPGEAAA